MNLKNYPLNRLSRLSFVMLLLGLVVFTKNLSAQVSLYTFSQAVNTYTPITGGTVLGNTSSDDNYIVDPVTPLGGFSATGVGFPIGFSFTYNGQAYDRFAVSCNGWISLGQSALTPSIDMNSSNFYTPLSSVATNTPAQLRARIAALAADLQGQLGSEIRVQLIGTAPNRVQVIQFTTFRRYLQTGHDLNFQIRLNEVDNSVEVRYGTMTFNATTNTADVGLGGSVATDFNNRTTTTNWTATTAGAVNTASCTFSTAVTAPGSGRTFKWVNIVAALDMQATGLVSPGVSGCYGTNQTVSVAVKNNGTTAINFATNPVTVNCAVTGPNATTFTPVLLNTGTLAAGASQTVTFSTTYNMSANGAYVFSASTAVVGDGNTANDAMPAATINVSRVSTFPHTEGFAALPSPAFLVQQVSGTGNWTIQTTGNMVNPALAPVLNPGFAYFNSYSFSTGTTSRLITPCYDMTTLNNPAIDIWISQDNGYATGPYDRVEVLVSTNGGNTWSAPLQSINRYNAAYATPGWLKVTVPLTTYNNNSSVRIALQGISQFGNNIGLDQIRVYDLVGVDLQPTVLVSPITNACHSSTETVTVSVRNNGVSTANFVTTPMTIAVNVTGASTQTFNATINTGTLAAGATSNYTVTTAANMTAQGNHNFAVTTTCTADGDNTNNTLAAVVGVGDISTFPALETFDATVIGWTTQQISGTGNWTLLTGSLAFPTLAPYSGTVTAYFNSFSYSTGTTSRLATPCINLTTMASPSLEFYMSADVGYPTNNDRVEVRVSTDGGLTYGPVLMTASRYDATYTTAGWKRYQLCLSGVANTANVRIAFDGVSAFGNNLAIENVRIYSSVPAVAGSATAAAAGVCLNDTATLTLAGNTGTIQWQSSATGLAGSWSNIAAATAATYVSGGLTDTTFYRAIVTNTNACARIDSTTAVQVNAYPLPTQPLSDTTQCGGSVTLDAQNAGSTYTWSTAAATQTISLSASATVSVMIMDANGCMNSDTAVVTINALPAVSLGADTTRCAGSVTLDAQNVGSTYLWSDATTAQTLTASASGVYAVMVTDANGCMGMDTVNVTINALPVVDLGADTAQCAGSVTLDAQNAGSVYLWNDATTAQTLTASASGVYAVMVTDANGCMNMDTVNVTINALPVVDLGVDTAQCAGSVTLDALNAGSDYLWNDATTAQTLTATASGAYSVMVTDANGCMNMDTVIVTINALPVVNVGADTTQCGGTVVLDAQNAGSTYLWSDNTTAQTLTVSSTGTYAVTVTDANGCVSTDTASITINALPAVTFTLASDTICDDGGSVVLTGATPAGGTYSGPGVSGGSIDPAVSGTGTHTITYSYTDANSCSASASQVIFVDNCSGIAENANNGSVNVFPNPNSGNFTLQVNTPAATELNIEVYGLDGRAVYTNRVNAAGQFTAQVSLEAFANGVYFVRVTGENGLISTTKVVKQD